MAEKKSLLDSLFRKTGFYRMPQRVSSIWEPIDLFLNREDKGLGSLITRSGQSLLSIIIPLGVVLFLVAGPTLSGRGWLTGMLVGIGFLAILATAKAKTAFRMQVGQAAVFLALGVAVAVLQPDEPRSLQGDLGFHVFIPLIVFVALWAVLSRWFAKYCLLSGRSRQEARLLLAPLLTRAQLFQEEPKSEDSPGAVLRAYATTLFSSYYLVLWIPAVAVLLAGSGLGPFKILETVRFNAIAFGLIAWATLAAAHYHSKLESLLETMRRGLFTGTPAVLSVLVIVLAAGRLLGISYIATLFEGSSAGVIISILLCLYFISWYDEYWTGRSVTRLLFALLQSDDTNCDDHAMEDGLAHIHVSSQGILHRFGSRRVLAVSNGKDEAKRVLHIMDVLRELKLSVRDTKNEGQVRKLLRELRERYLIYVTAGVVVTFAALVVMVMLMLKGPPKPGLIVDADAAGKVDVAQRIQELSLSDPAKDRPMVMVAASGGGSRAALHTAAGLRAIARQGYAGRILSLSSVSGGSAAVLGFISSDLSSKDPAAKALSGERVDPWSRYSQSLLAEYFSEVIRGMFEWRMTEGETLGDLLSESLAHRAGKRRCFGDLVGGPALCFNTAITGFRGGKVPIHRSSDLWEERLSGLKRGTSMDAGGRLVITNVTRNCLKACRAFGFPHVVVRGDDIPLSTAASMSANFPPVFSDVTIQVRRSSDHGASSADDYWSVTDGGAVENRGLLTSLKLLEDALDALTPATQTSGAVDGTEPAIRYSAIKILVLDASLLNSKYEGGRGFTAIGGAAAKTATAFARQWCLRLDERYRELGGVGVEIISLPMPAAIRSSSAFGTHWMPPSEVMLKRPSWVVGGGLESVLVPKERLPELIESVFMEFENFKSVRLSEDHDMEDIATWLWPFGNKETLYSLLAGALPKFRSGK